MDTIFGSPSSYVQAKDLIERTGDYLKPFGKKVLVLADEDVYDICGDDIIEQLQDDDYEITKVTFNGECSFKEIERIVEIGEEEDVDAVIGVGTGKGLDRRKAVDDE